MAWPNVLADLRTLLSDAATDKLGYRKTVFGKADGVNRTFKTLEYRRITTLVGATAPLGVYVNGAIVSVTSDSLATGEFVLAVAPANTDTIEATYYSQWFIDADLSNFISYAVLWIQSGATADDIPPGLQPSVIKYAAADAYQDLAAKWAINYSNQLRVEDQPGANKRTPMDGWLKMASSYRVEAVSLRDQFYRRSGKALAPNFVTVTGAVTPVVPRG